MSKTTRWLLLAIICIALCVSHVSANRFDDEDDDDIDVHAASTISSAAADNAAASSASASSSSSSSSSSSAASSSTDFNLNFEDDEDLHTTTSSERPPFSFQRMMNVYPYECVASAFVVLYIIVYIYGRIVNSRMAYFFYEQTKDLFQQQFTALSLYADHTHKDPLIVDADHSFKFYASGRRFVSGMLATLDLRRRQDLLAFFFSFIDLSPNQDVLNLEFFLGDEDMKNFVFAVCKKRDEKKLRKNNNDLETLATSVKSRRLPTDQFALLTDCPEVEADLLIDSVVNTIKANQDLFLSLHLTDENSVSIYSLPSSQTQNLPSHITHTLHPQYPKVLRFRFLLPSSSNSADYARLLRLIEMACQMVDLVGSLRVPAQALARARDLRLKIAQKNERAQQQQLLEKKREEKRQKEIEMVQQMTPEQRRKHEEKERKKQASKSAMNRVKILR